MDNRFDDNSSTLHIKAKNTDAGIRTSQKSIDVIPRSDTNLKDQNTHKDQTTSSNIKMDNQSLIGIEGGTK